MSKNHWSRFALSAFSFWIMACLVKEEGVVFYLESRFPPFVLCGKKIFEEERERERERDGEGD